MKRKNKTKQNMENNPKTKTKQNKTWKQPYQLSLFRKCSWSLTFLMYILKKGEREYYSPGNVS